MSENELFPIFIENGQDSEPQELEEEEEQLCWHCKKDTDKSNLMRPCKCANKFIHIHCLEIVANTENIRDCRIVKLVTHLEIQRQSLLKMLLKACVPFLMILLAIIANYMLGSLCLVMWQSLKTPNLSPSSIIMKIVYLSILVGFIYIIVCKIFRWSRRIYELCHEWYRSTYEWILISQDDNIQNIDETAV